MAEGSRVSSRMSSIRTLPTLTRQTSHRPASAKARDGTIGCGVIPKQHEAVEAITKVDAAALWLRPAGVRRAVDRVCGAPGAGSAAGRGASGPDLRRLPAVRPARQDGKA